MQSFIIVFCAFILAFHTSPSWADAEETLTQWQRMLDPDSGATFTEITDFLERHPTWPDRDKIGYRAERAMRAGGVEDIDIITWFTNHPPVSGIGKWSYAEALSRQHLKEGEILTLAKDAWRDADLTLDEERTFLATFGDKLSVHDFIARTDRLLWEEKTSPAERLMSHLPVKQQVLFQARMALMRDDKRTNFLLGQVDSKLKDDPGLLYERLRYRLRKNDKDGVRDILLHTPVMVPYPQRWWKMRETEIRRAIDEGNFHMASRLLSNHGQSDGSALADALWLDGWLKLQFLDNAQAAYQAFYHMHDAVKTPVSKARAAYWAGRAAKKLNDNETAKSWFSEASKHPTTFYGQLATSELADPITLTLPDEPGFTLFDSDPILADGLEDAIRISIQNGDTRVATRLINYVMEKAESDHSILSVAELGHKLNAPQISVKAAKKAQQQGVVLKNVGYPRVETDKDAPIERALTLAITRQESEFDPVVESPAGALGMMQLLPGTAKETAGKAGFDYSREMLYEPAYNMRVGSLYLSRLIDSYSGSYIMAIASYNGGPGNVRKWASQFGTPGTDPYGAIDWIEKIPFSETRNYVQRVLENVQVYRALDGNDTLKIKEDLIR